MSTDPHGNLYAKALAAKDNLTAHNKSYADRFFNN